MEPKGLAGLREPFKPGEIQKMCRSTKKDNPKGHCPKCGGYHGIPAIQLDYVGHAALTDRLLDCDPEWTWEPLAIGPNGLPVFDQNGGLWIKLTVCGVTRLGYGDSQGKQWGDAVKEAIGDALRNAAMRYGAALDLWHKGQEPLYVPEDEPKEPTMGKWSQADVDASVAVLDAFTAKWDETFPDDAKGRNAKCQLFYGWMQTKTFTEWERDVQEETRMIAPAETGWTSEQTITYRKLLGEAQVEFLKNGKTQDEFQAWAAKYPATGDPAKAFKMMESKLAAMRKK